MISNNTQSWRPNKKIIPVGLTWGNTVCLFTGMENHENHEYLTFVLEFNFNIMIFLMVVLI